MLGSALGPPDLVLEKSNILEGQVPMKFDVVLAKENT